MRINHLVWDHIYDDLEVNSTLRWAEFDLYWFVHYNCMCVVDYKKDIAQLYKLNRLYNNHNNVTTSSLRGIHVNVIDGQEQGEQGKHQLIPTLQVSCMLSLVETYAKQFHSAMRELEKMMKKKVGTMNATYMNDMEYKTTINYNRESIIYLYSISKDVLDASSLYQIDVLYMNREVALNYKATNLNTYSNEFVRVQSKFDIMFTRLRMVCMKYDVHILIQLSDHIKQAWNPAIKMFKMHHDLMYTLPKSPIRPRYYDILGVIRKRICIQSKWN